MRPLNFDLRLLLLLLLLAGCNVLRVPEAARPGTGVWKQAGGDAGRTNAVETTLSFPLVQAWRYNAEGAFGPGSPLLTDELVYVATRRGEVHAIRLETGKKAGSAKFGTSLEATPVLDQGALFVASALSRETLQRYDLARARKVWSHRGAYVEAAPLLADGTLFAGDLEGKVTALAATTGEVRWSNAPEAPSTIRAAPVLTRHGVAVARESGHLSMLDPVTGEALWARDVGAPVFMTPATEGDALYVPTTRGRFLSIDAATGAERWRFSVPDTTVRFSAPALSDAEVVFGGTDGEVRLLDSATGALRWTFTTDGVVSAAPLLTRDAVLVGTMKRMLYALDRATGSVRWQTELPGRMKSAMAVGEGGLVVLCEPRFVLYFKPDPDAAASL